MLQGVRPALNKTRQLLTYAYDVNLLDQKMHITKKNTEALKSRLVWSNYCALHVHVSRTEYATNSQHEDNKFFIEVPKLKNLGMILTNQNCTHKEINP